MTQTAATWQPPKTNWQPGDAFCLDPDYARIRGNLLYLQAWAGRIARRAALEDMAQLEIRDIPYAEFFNTVERNLAAVAAAVYPRPDYQTRQLSAGKPVWDWRDLDRIEGMELQIWYDLTALEAGLQKLQFKLGGGLLGTYIS